jgi:hypothetical protein
MFRTGFALASTLILALLLGPAAAADGRPELLTTRVDGLTRIWVETVGPDGTPHRSLLRETGAEATIRATGGDPAGRGLFATWDEDGERWAAHSRDGGATWSRARRLQRELRLRDGAILPGEAMPGPALGLALPGDGRLFVVQFRATSLPEWRETLTGRGIEILAALPHHGHIVRTDADRLAEIRSFEFVERVEPYHPSYRIEPELRQALLDEADGLAMTRVRVMTFEWGIAAKERVIEAAEAIGAQVAEFWPSGHVVELWVGADHLRALAAHDDVMWIDRWTPPGYDMDLVRQDAGSDWVETSFGYCGTGVRGEVMDSGIQADHPDFDGIILHGTYDVGSHGTSTYGIVFGNGDRDGDGDGKATGQLPCGQGIFADNGEVSDRFAHTQELKQAPYFASFQTNSWGALQTTVYTSDSYDMDDIIWRLDIAILNSQSNTGNQSSRPEAWAKNVISVGGIRHYDTLDTSDDAWASGASIGPAQDGRIKPDVSYWYDDIYTTTTGSSYTPGFGGTSAATPESAGTLGLMLEMWADNVWGTDPVGATVFERQPHFSTLKALLINNSQQYDFTGSGHDLSRFKQGWGRPSARVAYERAADSLVVDEEVVLELNDLVDYSVAVAPGQTELKVTLVYPDPPGTTSSSMHRINDVNLRVTSPSATVYHGNVGLETGTESTSGGSADTLNTVENVFVRDPESGIWTVRVEAVEINQDAHLDTTTADDVTFALVVTGGSAVYTSGEGDLRLTPAENACDQSFQIRVRDGNVGSSTVTVDVWSDTEATPETVTLQETPSGSGIFTAEVPTSSGSPVGGDGVVSVAHGDTLTTQYVDADDGAGGSNVAIQQAATIDCQAPVISMVTASEITDTEATITWVTDEQADSKLTWGATTPPDQPIVRAGSRTAHTVRIRGLSECTTYYYEVGGEDGVGNAAEDDNGGSYYLFTTLTYAGGGGLHSCREGALVIEANAVSCEGAVPLTLTDTDLNFDPGAVETASVFVTSSTETTPETVVLTETGVDTGVFTGSIPTGPGAVVSGDGTLQTSHDDLVTGRHDDVDDGTGSPGTSIYTVSADCEGAEIAPVSVTNITETDARIDWTTSEFTTGHVEWGTTPALGNQVSSSTLKTDHFVTIGTFAQCGRVYFRVVATDAWGNVSTADAEGSPFEFNANGIPGIFWQDGFETDLGWTLDGEWEIGAPQGLGTAPGDPSSAFEGSGVLGHDLSGQGTWPGDYEPETAESAVSPVIDASGVSNGELKFRRRLNVTNGSFAYIDVKDSGGSWNQVFATGIQGLSESSWTAQTIDVSSYADGNSSFQIRIRERSHIASSHDAGWNVDALVLRDGSLPDVGVCGGCLGAPTFAGLSTAVDNDPCADSGVTLTWSGAPGWGTGAGGTYAVYRDTTPGFTPGPGNLVASGLTGTSWIDAAAPNDTTLYYVVRAENDETCSGGPNNGGVTDVNLVYGVARDDTAQTPPGDVGNTLLLDGVNRAHARLTWSPTAGAAVYRVYRSAAPDGTFGLEATVAPEVYDDPDVFTDGMDWYYLVRAADACGNEGP